jgi:flagellar assembly factor FliW
MIKFETSRFGTLDVMEEKVVNFPEGLLGFPEIKRYVVMDYKDTCLKWLQAVDDPDIAFIVAPPEAVGSGIEVVIDTAALTAIGLGDDKDLALLYILRVQDGKTIINSEGPLAINTEKMLGAQLVLNRAC